ncbi:inclusion membrane protein IncB [Chlamydiifrater volucris]|uniref:inclusion membrane protein IncB n=1 Tax=Chlamydiifrater volucris TaxID=2681470 RepID=UPI001BCD80CA|nr:inclusion membrane protein IncB [Chlamydiifrater volucris]
MTHTAPNPYVSGPLPGAPAPWGHHDPYQYGSVTSAQYNALCAEIANIKSSLDDCCKGSHDSKRSLDIIRDELVGVKSMALELFEEARDRRSSSQESGAGPDALQATVYQNKPTCCESLSALLLTIIALVSITVLACCLVAACGGFPLLMTILNACSLGAIVALPILASVSSTVATLSILATYMILNAHSYRVELSRMVQGGGSGSGAGLHL